MAFCGCFKSNAQVTDSQSSKRGERGNRPSIRKGKGDDLLELNKRGAGPNEEWIDEDEGPNDPVRRSHNTDISDRNEEHKVS